MAPMGAWRKNAKGHSTVNAVNPFVCVKGRFGFEFVQRRTGES